MAAANAPAPRGDFAVRMQSGSLGSAGALVEVAATGAGQECRSIWRLREGKLAMLPLQSSGGARAACEAAGEWTSRFEREAPDAPASYLRERTTQKPGGAHRQIQVFRFSGFALDLARMRAEIEGVAIPDWYDATLYSRPAMDALFERFDFEPVRSLPQLTIDADPARGVFALRFRDAGGETQLPVRGSSPGPENGVTLRVDGEKGPTDILVRLTKDVPYEVEVRGLSDRLDNFYSAVSRIQDGAFRVYPNAAAELAANGLPGTWTSEAPQTVTIAAAPDSLERIRLDDESFAVDLDHAPEGLDVLLVPEKPKPPSWALDLRGPHALVRVPVRCAAWPAPSPCVGAGPGVVWRRVGSRINLR